ncbi:BirA family biotin operon repressor/biotin-[acetyl-CoA-carboxylase] ligase [Thiobaca trueperi]|uniref:biotin--[biotin carboxyl-carrier protein] ligase n=1 Tax=Thiobaca trueperi TaxID=127458 RepID=A0A4R3N139_9GAMM|nr:BirA family biotin operon repressor/biotin-[acetyl-CoA-carboxylase] ligase [Thiobaca trueperi]
MPTPLPGPVTAGWPAVSELELLDTGQIRAGLSDAGRDRLARLEIHDQIDSTNTHLMREASAGAPSGAVCLAERQTAGRGRRGRAWISPFGVNLYLSILWRYPLAPAALGGASLAVGAALAEILRTAGVSDLALKWPNDILWQGRKLAGLLLEVAGESQGPSHLVVGVGLNLRMDPTQGNDIDQPWTTLDQALNGKPLSRNRLAARILDDLMAALEQYGSEGLAPFLDRWRQFDTLQGKPVRLLMGERIIEGRHAGIGPDGSLQLDTPDGRRSFQTGEVSLRGS